jgi:hypothetical protein
MIHFGFSPPWPYKQLHRFHSTRAVINLCAGNAVARNPIPLGPPISYETRCHIRHANRKYTHLILIRYSVILYPVTDGTRYEYII